MRAVDTYALVRLVTRDDERQVSAAEAFVARGAWVPHLAEAARQAGHLPLGTFDRNLGRQGAERL